MKKVIFILYIILCLAPGCKPKQKITDTSVTNEVTKQSYIHTEKLNPFKLPEDSSRVRALFRCDSLNNVLMVELFETKTKGLESRLSFHNGELDYNIKSGGDTVYLPSETTILYDYRYINKLNQRTYNITKSITKIKLLTIWQKINIFAGKCFFLFLSWMILYFIVKYRTKLKIYSLNLLKFKK